MLLLRLFLQLKIKQYIWAPNYFSDPYLSLLNHINYRINNTMRYFYALLITVFIGNLGFGQTTLLGWKTNAISGTLSTYGATTTNNILINISQ